MRQIPADPVVMRQVWEPEGDYRRLLGNAFANFTAWQDGLIEQGLHLAPVGRGPLPGDMTVELPFEGGRVGIAVLNSTWLQLSGDDYRQRLHVDPRQLNDATGGDPVAWCRERQVKLLVTHQPPTWLHPTSRALWNGEISPPSRFDLHMFGHMHQHAASATARGGGAVRYELQAASVCALEVIGGGVE